MKLFNELPTILPFYTDQRNQNRFKENVKKNCHFKLLSPNNRMLPFMIKLPKGSPKPTSMKLINCDNSVEYDISENINKLKASDFESESYCWNIGDVSWTYGGTRMSFKGTFYLFLLINNIEYYSEVFCMTSRITVNKLGQNTFSDDLIKIEFYDEKDIEPLRYRHGMSQHVYLETYIHTSEPEIEEENEPDGTNQPIPTFQKMVVRQKMELYVPDFLKNALMSLQLHEKIKVFDQNKRIGDIDRIKITSSPDETGAFSNVSIALETDVLVKTECDSNKQATNPNLWV